MRRERKLDAKTDVAVRRLERLEREQDEQDDHDREASMTEALTDKTKVVKLVVDKWFVERGFDFGKVSTGEIVFIHASAVVGAEVLTIGTDAWVQVVNDDARAQGRYRARRAWGQDVWRAEKDKEKANKVAQQVRRAAALTAELAAQSEKKTAAVCDQPPGLDELAGHIEAPNMEAGGSHPQATMMPVPWATFKCPSANQAMVTSPLPSSQSFSNFSGKSRKGRPRSSTRAQDNTAVLEETLKLFVEATGKDEASMRQQLVSKRSVELLRDREFWRTRVEEKQRFQAKKKEAWEFFRRAPSLKPKSQEEFDEEFRRRVMTGYSSGSTEGREKFLDEWKIELQKALEGDSRLEARERVKMGEEDSSSRRRTEWERIFDRSPFLKTARRRLLSGDNFQQLARVSLLVSEGERVMTQENNLLGKFYLDRIQPAPRGLPQAAANSPGWLSLLVASTSPTRDTRLTHGQLSKVTLSRFLPRCSAPCVKHGDVMLAQSKATAVYAASLGILEARSPVRNHGRELSKQGDGVGSLVFVAHGNRSCQCFGKMGLCDRRDVKEQTSVPSRLQNKVLSVPKEVTFTPQQTVLVVCRLAKWTFFTVESSSTRTCPSTASML